MRTLENYSAKSIDESKQSVYFTPNEGHLSPQPMQNSPIHINYINENMVGCESMLVGYNSAADFPRSWRSASTRTLKHQYPHHHRFSYPYAYTSNQLPNNGSMLDEDEEVTQNFIIPEQTYNNNSQYKLNPRTNDQMSGEPIPSTSGYQNNRLKSCEKQKLRNSFEKERLLLNDIKREFKEFNHQEQTKQRKKKSKMNDTFFSMEDMPSDAYDLEVMTSNLPHLETKDDSVSYIKKVFQLSYVCFINYFLMVFVD